MIARCCVENRQGLCPIRIMNLSENNRRLKKGDWIGQADDEIHLREKSAMLDNDDIPDHLKDLFNETCEREQLSSKTAEKLRKLLVKHSRVFAVDGNALGYTDLVQHKIHTGKNKPIRQPPRRVPTALQEEFDEEMQKMLDKGAIESGSSPWASPVVLVKKKDGHIRFCVDYRRLNELTEFDAYPLPRIDETFEALSGALYFSTLDLLSGYWQVGLTSDAQLKSAFCVRSGLYLWNVMPFGLCNAPPTFERLMETVLSGLQWKSCLIYLDDVVIFARTEEELLERMDDVFQRLGDAN